jgi:hypothetical protein
LNQILHSFFSHRCKNNMLCYGGGFVLRLSRCKKNRSIFSYSAIVFVLHCKPSDDITEFHHPRYLPYVILHQFFACAKKCSARVKNWMLLGSPAKSGKPLTLFIWCPTKPRTLPVSSNSVFCAAVQARVPLPVSRTREPLNQSAAALSGFFAPTCRFENLEIRKGFLQFSNLNLNKIPR